MRRWMVRILAFAAIGFAVFWMLSAPQTLPDAAMAGLKGDAVNGEQVFHAAGCASCHASPGAEGKDKLVLSGGQRFPSPFGTFIAPNITPDRAQGIGTWSTLELANAMIYGVSPTGQHYYPAFPYGSYVRLKLSGSGLQDIKDLHVFLQSLPASDMPSKAHEVGFPFNIRRGLGLWKLAFTSDYWVASVPLDDPALLRGRTLVEALGHCGECHTPRNAVGGLQYDKWLAGAADPSGEGRVPAIHALEWSAKDIAYYLESGFTPDYDSAGGHMVNVIENMSKLPPEDRAAIAAYLKALGADD